jgi:hypothetical protein
MSGAYPRGEQSNMHKVNIFKNLFINDKKTKKAITFSPDKLLQSSLIFVGNAEPTLEGSSLKHF